MRDIYLILSLSFILSSCVVGSQDRSLSTNFNQNKAQIRLKQPTNRADLTPDKVVRKIALGSCSDMNRDQSGIHWTTALSLKPDLWIWLGDNIYADTHHSETLAKAYQAQLDEPSYLNFQQQVPIIGIWDDHDYAYNNSGSKAPNKIHSQRLFLDFIGEPQNSQRRQQEGIYTSYHLGQPKKDIKIILLDTRYHLESDKKDGNVLGERQWQWLENELKQSKARFHLIASGIQILPMDHRFEKWSDYPKERNRLLNLIKKHKPRGVMLLSGDRHIAEISQIPGKSLGLEQKFLTELTSSGLTHSYTNFKKEVNRYRNGKVFFQRNLGVIEFDWEKEPATAKLQIRDINGRLVHHVLVDSHHHGAQD